MLRASKTLQPQKDTRRANLVSINLRFRKDLQFCSSFNSFRARAFMAAVPARKLSSRVRRTGSRRLASCLARSASPCKAKVFTMELRSSRYRCKAFAARALSGPLSESRGTISARCHRNSICSASSRRPSNSCLQDFNNSGRDTVIFSAASAARIRTTGSSFQRHLKSSAKRPGWRKTSFLTSLDRPIDRRSPPLSMAAIAWLRISGLLGIGRPSFVLRGRTPRLRLFPPEIRSRYFHGAAHFVQS